MDKIGTSEAIDYHRRRFLGTAAMTVTGRSPGSLPTPTMGRHRHSCECRKASRAEE